MILASIAGGARVAPQSLKVLVCFYSLVASLTPWLAAETPNFPAPYNTRQTNSQFLSPEEALKSIHLPTGFVASLFAAEPAVEQPIGMTMDARGRLWVAENYACSERPLGWETDFNDRIIILEDTSHDGHFGKRTIFWDRAKKLTSVSVGFGGVYALCPPR